VSTPAQRRANSKWAAKNRAKTRVYSLRSTAKRFILNFATDKDLRMLESYIVHLAEEYSNYLNKHPEKIPDIRIG
jgi:hypothetical protein